MGLANDWTPVITSISKLEKRYRLINRVISLGLDIKVRRVGVRLAGPPQGLVLDAGAGDGSLTIELLKTSNKLNGLVLLDPLMNMLKIAKEVVNDYRAHYVVGLLEAPPFRDSLFDKVYMAFSLRDMYDLDKALRNLFSIMRKNAKLTVIDIGKPDHRSLQLVFSIYWSVFAPFLTLFTAPRAWRLIYMIHPTYRRLLRNSKLIEQVERYFKLSLFKQLFFGGIVIIIANKSS
jgi:ubiquinone/menaquinone biosynthesis C-methylase UbiE